MRTATRAPCPTAGPGTPSRPSLRRCRRPPPADAVRALRGLAVEQLDVPEERLTASAALAEDLAVDSLALTELVMQLEDDVQVVVPDDVLADLVTWGDLEQAVRTRVDAGPGGA